MTQEPKLTFEQAYRAMYYFLENEYQLTKSDELGGILGSLSWHIWEPLKTHRLNPWPLNCK